MPAASPEASPVVSTHSLRPMDLLQASLRSVPAAVARKAVKTWAMQRRFWGGKNDRFKGKMGTNGSGGQIWRIRRHADAHMDVADEGTQGGRSVVTGGIEKLLRPMGVIGTVGLWRHNDVFLLLAHLSVKKYCHHMIL